MGFKGFGVIGFRAFRGLGFGWIQGLGIFCFWVCTWHMSKLATHEVLNPNPCLHF